MVIRPSRYLLTVLKKGQDSMGTEFLLAKGILRPWTMDCWTMDTLKETESTEIMPEFSGTDSIASSLLSIDISETLQDSIPHQTPPKSVCGNLMTR